MGDAQGKSELSRGQTPETDKSQRSSSLQSNKSEGHQSRKEKHEKERRALQADGWITTDQTTHLINPQDQENDHHQNGMNTPQDQEDDHYQSGTNEETATRNQEMYKEFVESCEPEGGWQPTQDEKDEYERRTDEAMKNAEDTEECGKMISGRIAYLEDKFDTRREELEARQRREMHELDEEEDKEMKEVNEARDDICERSLECVEQIKGLTKGKGGRPAMTYVKIRPLPTPPQGYRDMSRSTSPTTTKKSAPTTTRP